ncbi:hypothetical protein GCM10022262_21360 [Georgenia daeguensis]|uniref:Uncharacterized protein n=1 Tax=Georgenia daeguensis TaxID=908355 RepID=A0ABP8EUV9_9MICO
MLFFTRISCMCGAEARGAGSHALQGEHPSARSWIGGQQADINPPGPRGEPHREIFGESVTEMFHLR